MCLCSEPDRTCRIRCGMMVCLAYASVVAPTNTGGFRNLDCHDLSCHSQLGGEVAMLYFPLCSEFDQES